MKLTKSLLTLCLLLSAGMAFSQVKYSFTEASDLTLVGKLMDTPNPYHRVDTVKYRGFTKSENRQVRTSSGIAVAFRTNSSTISVLTEYGYKDYSINTCDYSSRGYDLYIRKDGEWLWAAAECPADGKEDRNLVLVKNMDASMKECLMYFPMFSEEYSVKVGVEEGSVIEAVDNPFRHRIGVFGSSYTQGVSTGRCGMTWPAQFSRMTGLQLLSLGCAGNCKLQQHFADVLCDADVDAFIFDSFSNPNPEQMRARLFPFIEKIQAAHPGKPLIFQSTIVREKRNFDRKTEAGEAAKMHTADSLMAIAVKKYEHVYYVHPSASSPDHEASVDGSHPSSYGYTLWAKSIEKPVRRILRKYGIR